MYNVIATQRSKLDYWTASSTEDNVFSYRTVSGIEAVVEDVVRRLKGDCWYAPGYGFDIRRLVNVAMDNDYHVFLRPIIASYCMKNRFVRMAYVDTLFSDETLTISITLVIKDVNNNVNVQLTATPTAVNL